MRRIQKIQQKIQEDIRPVRMQGLLKNRQETPEEFIVKFFTKWNNEKNTIFVNDNDVQTDTGRRRSLGDIYRVVQYYYPEITLEEVTSIIYKKCFDKIARFRSSYCHTIRKRVFYVGAGDQSSDIFDRDITDEYEMTISQWRNQIRNRKKS